MTFSDKLVQQVWEKGRVDSQADPAVWRKDECGAWVRRTHYGDRESEFGWEIDYITAGGPRRLDNLRVVHWKNYLAGGVGHVVCKVTADSAGINNREA